MSEDTNHDIKPAIVEDEHKSGEGCATNKCDKGLDGHESLSTGNELPGGSNLVGESELWRWRNPLLLDHRKILLVLP